MTELANCSAPIDSRASLDFTRPIRSYGSVSVPVALMKCTAGAIANLRPSSVSVMRSPSSAARPSADHASNRSTEMKRRDIRDPQSTGALGSKLLGWVVTAYPGSYNGPRGSPHGQRERQGSHRRHLRSGGPQVRDSDPRRLLGGVVWAL